LGGSVTGVLFSPMGVLQTICPGGSQIVILWI
jgi:hypothetical protein